MSSDVISVLVVDDHTELLELVVDLARTRGVIGWSPVTSAAGATAKIATEAFDVIVLDIGLADGSGLDVCRDARERGVVTPILFLTARAAVDQRVQGLDAGAGDFLAKPFAVAELRARVRALARRGRRASSTWVRGGATLDFPRRRATVDGNVVPLTAKEWGILDVLAAAGGRVVSRTRILEEVWTRDDAAAGASLDVLMARIRKKLGGDAVRTLRGEGYALG